MDTTTIYTTKDYNIFRKMAGNRSVEESRVNTLINSIRQIGWVSNPIIVNEKMEVVDGQGRLEALKRLNMPVEYHFASAAGLDACRVMNSSNKAWKPVDYIASYADSGNENYKRVLTLMKFFNVKVNTVLNSVGINTSGTSSEKVKSGKLIFRELDYINASYALNIRKKYLPVMDRFGGRRDTRDNVVFYLVAYGKTHSNVDHNKIVDALDNADPRDIYAQNFERLLESVQKVYNRGKKKRENRLYFYEEYRLDNNL